VTLALKNLTRENLRFARAQFARRECIPQAWFFSSRAEKGTEGWKEREREEGEKKRRGKSGG